ncbi:hypothetical protein DFJ74DRAFT_657513 [Hyaloraphidium curvatum]|nr:hypothetical protein DFJ74DRAFT_657513 [Hyaloraphidium curvatum]
MLEQFAGQASALFAGLGLGPAGPLFTNLFASPGAQYILKIGTTVAVLHQVHQIIFRRAWDENWWPERRIQPGKALQAEPTGTIRAKTRTEIVIGSYVLVGMFWLLFQQWYLDVNSPPPEPLTAVKKIILAILYCDFFYYWYHRAEHDIPWLYRNFHKKHHQFYVNSPEAAEWDELQEHVMVGFLTNGLPSYLAGMDFTTHWIWVAMNAIRHEHHHSGFDFAWYPFNRLPIFAPAGFHHDHHAKNAGNYAIWTRIMDYVFGTDRGTVFRALDESG